MIPVGAYDRVDGSAGDSDPGSTIRICFPRLPDPIWAQSVATIDRNVGPMKTAL